MAKLVELGMNFNNKLFFEVLDKITDLRLYDISVLNRLQIIGFSFNNPVVVEKLKKVAKYIDLNDPISYQNMKSKNININNPFFEDVIKKYSKIGLAWSDNSFLSDEEHMLNTIKKIDVKRLIKLLDDNYINNGYNTFMYYCENDTKKSQYKLMYGDFEEHNEYYPIENKASYIDEYGVYNTGKSVLKKIVSNIKYEIGYVSLFDLGINKYEEYGIKLIKNPDVFIGDMARRKYLYPNNYLNVNSEEQIVIGEGGIKEKLEILLEFLEEKGFDESKLVEENDINDFASANGLNIRTQVVDRNDITQIQIKEIYKSFDKIGLNIRDDVFQNKINKLKTKFKLFLPASVYVQNNKTTELAHFDSLNKLGFHFGNSDYLSFMNKLNGKSFDMSKTQTKYIVDSLSSIGWHINSKNTKKKLDKLYSFGFSFEIFEEINNTTSETLSSFFNLETVTNDFLSGKAMNSKLNVLNNFGFNFNTDDWEKKIDKLKDLGLKINNNNFETAISKLISFGINLNDDSWEGKINKIKKLEINFSSQVWQGQMNNLEMLGVTFVDDDWLDKYNRIMEYNHLGIDYKDVENKEKLLYLKQMGLDFSKPKDEYMTQVNALIKLKLITMPPDVEKKKIDFEKKKIKEIEQLRLDIEKKSKIKSGEIYNSIDKKIIQLNNDIIIITDELKMINNKDEYDKKCEIIKSNELLISKMKNEKSRYMSMNIDNDILELNKKLDKLKEQKETDNIQRIIIADVDKLKSATDKGINFMYPDWETLMLEMFVGFNFAMPNWKDKLAKIPPFPQDPRIAIAMSKIKSIIILVMTPFKLLIGIIKKLLDLITQFIGIPLNILDIPDWTKGIISKFTTLIDMLKGLPTLDGIMDILFMSKDGLMIIDMVVPGFATFFGTMMEMVSNKKNMALNIDKEIKNKKLELKKKIDSQNKRKKYILNKISINKSLLGENDEDVINMIKEKIDMIQMNQERLKLLINKVETETSLKNLENEMNNNCDRINELEKQYKEIIELSNTTKSDDELRKEILDYENELNRLDEVYDIDKLKSEINEKEDKSKELKNKSIELGSICNWGNNLDSIIIQLKEMMNDMVNSTNPFEPLIKIIDKKITLMKKNIDNLNKQEDVAKINSEKEKEIKKLSKLIDKQQNDLENDVCNVGISEIEKDKRINEISEMKKLLYDKEKELNNSSIDLDLVLEQKQKTKEIINKLEKEKTELIKKSEQFKKDLELKIDSMNNIVKHLPTISNIICTSPKVIVNVFVGLLNAVGHMDNLPTLWEFSIV